MPSTYKRKPPVTCFNCGDDMIKRRTSKSGRYYCPKTDCQAERHRDWIRDRVSPEVRELQDSLTRIAQFVSDALHNAHATCQDCGATNVPTGWAHFDRTGSGCAGLGIWNGRVNRPVVDAVWPESARTYADAS